MLSTGTVGAALGFSDDTIRRQIEAGRIPAQRTFGGAYRIPARWLREQTAPTSARTSTGY